MKSYTKKMLSLTSSLLIAAQQCFVAMPAGAVDTPSEAENYAQSIGLELNSGAAKDTLSDLIDINDEGLAVAVDDNNNVTQIDGLLSNETVDSSNDAKDIIAKTSELLGIDNVNREIRLDDVSESDYNKVYTFKQFYQGLEMVNSYITVVVDKETGEAEFLNSSYVSDFSINTTPAISVQQANNVVNEKFNNISIIGYDLVIYSENDNDFKLAWRIKTDTIGVTEVYVDAVTSEILKDIVVDEALSPVYNNRIYSNSLLLNYSDKILPENVYSFDVDVSKEGSLYYLRDIGRNLYVCVDPSYSRAKSSWAPYESHILKSYNNQFNSSEVEQLGVAVLYNVKRVYDFFNSNFGHKGFDGKNSKFYLVPNVKSTTNGRESNAWSAGNALWFGEGNGTTEQSFASDIDVIGHEFGHSVTGSKVQWGGSNGQTGALNEAYADIFGEYCDNTREWQIGTDIYKKNTGKNTTNKKTTCIRDLTIRKNHNKSTNYVSIGNHEGSKVISHTAYWMDKLGIEANTAVKIWFTSLDYLPKGGNKATFDDCRKAVVRATQKVVQNKAQSEYVVKVKTAFNRVHVYDNNEIIGDLCHDGKLDSFDLVILKQAVMGTKSLTPAERAQADLNFDGKVNSADVTLLQNYVLGKITDF